MLGWVHAMIATQSVEAKPRMLAPFPATCLQRKHVLEWVRAMMAAQSVEAKSRLLVPFPATCLQRKHVLEWVRAMMAVTLGVKYDEELPPVYIQEPTKPPDDAWSQISE